MMLLKPQTTVRVQVAVLETKMEGKAAKLSIRRIIAILVMIFFQK